MKIFRLVALALLLAASPAVAQWQTPNHSVPVGKGSGNTGFSAAVPGVLGRPLVSTGPNTDPAFGTIGNAGFTAGPANTTKGSLDGTTATDIPWPDCQATNTALRWTAGTGPGCGSILTLTGFDMPINTGLTASVAGGALTIGMTTAAGSIPTAVNPVFIPFRSLTSTNGGVTWGTVNAATSIVVPSGATLGTTNSVPFRVWLFAVANGGTPALGVAVCSTATAVLPCASWEYTLKTTTTISAGATSAGVLYATAGVTLDAVRIIGYCDFASGLGAVGTWSSSCTTVQVFGPGVKKPGDVVQGPIYSSDASNVNCTSSTFTIQTSLSASITPSSTINMVSASSQVSGSSATATFLSFQTSRGTGPTLIGTIGAFGIGAVSSPVMTGSVGLQALDKPNTTSATTYTVFCKVNGSTSTYNASGSSSTMMLYEIMGALPEPANDNGLLSKVG